MKVERSASVYVVRQRSPALRHCAYASRRYAAQPLLLRRSLLLQVQVQAAATREMACRAPRGVHAYGACLRRRAL